MATNELVEQPARAIGDWTRRLALEQFLHYRNEKHEC